MSFLSGVPIIGSQDVIANQPDPATVPDGYVFFATDSTTYYVQFGGAWFSIGGGGGGGSTAREKLSGNAVTIPAGTDSLLTFDTVVSGDTLVDLTDPSHPAIIDTGVYVVGLYVGVSTPMIPADSYFGILALDAAGENAQIAGTATVGAGSFPYGPLTLAYYIPAAGTITVDVFNESLTNDYNFNLAGCVIQRIS